MGLPGIKGVFEKAVTQKSITHLEVYRLMARAKSTFAT